MRMHLPNSAFLGNIDPFLNSFDTSNPEKLIITSNQKWISVHPVVLSMITAIGLTVEPSNILFEKLEATSKHYLERIGLFKMLNIPSEITIEEHEPAGRFIPLTRIKTSEELSQFISELAPLLHLNQEKTETIRYVVGELVRNVLEHAQTKKGAIVCAQYYKKSNTVRIGIADTGIGIKKSISESHKASTDFEAIQLALTPGITGTTRKEGGTEMNAGAGLFFTRAIAKVNRDFFMIYSGTAMYKLLKSKKERERIQLHADPCKEHYSKKETLPRWRGTVVGVDISVDATKEFSALLDTIRETYRKVIQERKKERQRRPRFI